MSDEMILTADESRALIHAMTHPDEDALRKRDAFIRDVRDLKIDYEAGEITAEVQLCEERTCESCKYDLGGGYNNCRINLESECAAGNYEAWKPKEDAK